MRTLEFDTTTAAWRIVMLILALISTVALLVCMGFFMMGSLPLLILKHDTPLDSHFIRGCSTFTTWPSWSRRQLVR